MCFFEGKMFVMANCICSAVMVYINDLTGVTYGQSVRFVAFFIIVKLEINLLMVGVYRF